MSEESLRAILEAESHTEETRSFIKQVRRLTRRKFTPEEKIRIVLEGFRHEVPIRDLCREISKDAKMRNKPGSVRNALGAKTNDRIIR